MNRSGDCALPDLDVRDECDRPHVHHDGGVYADDGDCSMLANDDGSVYNVAQHLYHVHVDANAAPFHYCNKINNIFALSVKCFQRTFIILPWQNVTHPNCSQI